MHYKSTKVDINIKSIQTYDKDDSNTIDVATDGIILSNGSELKINYDEILVDDASYYTTTNLSFKEDERNIVYMTRSGGINSTCIFEEGKRYKFPYQFPFGVIEITIYTKHLDNNITPEGGYINIQYTTELAGSVLNETNFSLWAKKEKPFVNQDTIK